VPIVPESEKSVLFYLNLKGEQKYAKEEEKNIPMKKNLLEKKIDRFFMDVCKWERR